MPDPHWHPYTTRARHIAYGDSTLRGLKVYEIGTPCLAARLPDYRVALTFDDVSIVLDENWYLKDIERPELLQPKWVRDIQALEDGLFMQALEDAIRALELEKVNGRT